MSQNETDITLVKERANMSSDAANSAPEDPRYSSLAEPQELPVDQGSGRYTSVGERVPSRSPTEARELPPTPGPGHGGGDRTASEPPSKQLAPQNRTHCILFVVLFVVICVIGGVVGFLTWKVVSQESVTQQDNVRQYDTGGSVVTTTPPVPIGARDCGDIIESGVTHSGVYNISVAGETRQVYCDMNTDEGGWTVLLRRKDNSVSFVREWEDYRLGFGDLGGEFYAGNELIHLMTYEREHSLRVDLTSYTGEYRYAVYQKFSLTPETDKFRLVVHDYSGTAGDSLSYHNSMRFSTKLMDNDLTHWYCADLHGAPWWYHSCVSVLLTGEYGEYPAVKESRGIMWQGAWGEKAFAKYAEMKIRSSQD